MYNKTKHFIYVFLICLVILIFSKSTGATYLSENLTWEQNLTGFSSGSISFGDIDKDGDLDLIGTGSTSSNKNIKIYINNGTSLLENITWFHNLTGINYGSQMFGDIDNDGDLDLALTGCNSGADAVSQCATGYDLTKIYLNNGTSLIENITWEQNLTAMYRSSLSFGDLDNDGDLDLALTGESRTNNNINAKIYLNNGTSLVESEQWSNNLTGVTDSFIVLGDIDNNEYLDLILSGKDNEYNKVTKVYLNNGTSLVESEQWYVNIHAVNEGSLSLGDFDIDGDLDLTLTGCCDHHRIYQNNGTSFVEIQKEDPLAYDSLGGILESSQSLGDYDNDGDLDLVTTGREGYTAVYLGYNNCTFSLSKQDPESHLPNYDWGSVAWSDIDNNTKLDLVLTGFDGNLFHALTYINNITTTNTQPTPPTSFVNYTTIDGNIHLGWTNGSDTETPTNGLYYNLRVGSASGGNQIISGIYGGGEDNGYFGNMLQRKNITLKSTRLNPNTPYYWSVQTIDTGLRKSVWSSEQAFITGGDLTTPTITLNAPISNFNTSNPAIAFNTTVYDNIKVQNVSLYGNWTGWHLNTTNSSGLNNTDYIFTKNLTPYGDGIYIWAIRSCDNSTLCEYSENRTFTIDTTYPYIYLKTPANESTWSSSNIVTFTYNATDITISNCSLIINNNISQTNSGIAERTDQTFTYPLTNGNYDWYINCTDIVSHTNLSTKYKLTVFYNPVTGGPSHGGTSISTAPTTEITNTPSTIPLTQNQPTQVSIGSITHTITILSLTKTSVTLKINPILTLNLGETKIITLNNQKLSITLNKIQNSKAYLSFNLVEETAKEIKEEVSIEKPQESKKSAIEKIQEISKKSFSYINFLLILFLIIIIYFYYKKSKKQKWWLKGS